MNYLIQDELEAEFNARFDYVSEAFGDEARALAAMAAAEHEEEVAEFRAEIEAFGPHIHETPGGLVICNEFLAGVHAERRLDAPCSLDYLGDDCPF